MVVFSVHLLYGPWPLATGYMGWGQTCVAVNSDRVGVAEGETVTSGGGGRPPVSSFPNGPLHLPARRV